MRGLCRTMTILATMLVAGCSSFEREWKQAASTGDSGLVGRWQGTWVSEVNRHHGKLRCIVSPGAGNVYHAHFRATYETVLHFTYTVDLQTTETGSLFEFQGTADLGIAGGVYHYVGHADGTNFTSTYACQSDHGTFKMSRP